MIYVFECCPPKDVQFHRGVLRVANVDATPRCIRTVKVNLVSFEPGCARAVLVADTSAAIVDHHAVIHIEALCPPGGIVGAANIAPQAIALLIVDEHSSCYILGYPLDGRTVEAQRRLFFAVFEELGVADSALHVADAYRGVVMDSGERHLKVRTRRPSSDSTRAVTSAAGLQLDYRNGLWNLSIDTGSGRSGSALLNKGRRSGLALEIVASLEDGWR